MSRTKDWGEIHSCDCGHVVVLLFAWFLRDQYSSGSNNVVSDRSTSVMTQILSPARVR
jgi:hypothetical protein